MKVLGYFEGTDPSVLTRVVLEGYETLPLSNGWDNHGKHLTLLNHSDNVAVVVGSLHKFIRMSDMSIFNAMVSTVKSYKIPIIFVVPKDMHDKAAKVINDSELKYKFVDPDDLAKTVLADLAD